MPDPQMHPGAIDAQFDRITQRMLHIVESQVDALAERPAEPPSLPLTVFRRTVANHLRLWRFCAQRQCHRAKCCRGEPLHCLGASVPLLPPGALDTLLGSRKRRRR